MTSAVPSPAGDPPAVDPALAVTDGHHRRELCDGRRVDWLAEAVVKCHESRRRSGQQHDVRSGAAMPADADVEVARIETGRLEDLHLDDGYILAVTCASV